MCVYVCMRECVSPTGHRQRVREYGCSVRMCVCVCVCMRVCV